MWNKRKEEEFAPKVRRPAHIRGTGSRGNSDVHTSRKVA